MQLRVVLFFLTMGMICFCATSVQAAGIYLSSAHGSTTYGVDRPDLNTAGFAVANCAHCHEQHASIHGTGGNEFLPVTGAKEYLLFDQSNTVQAINFCFNCHGTGTAYQTGGHVSNRSYSYRAGGWADPLNDNIKDAFGQASSHQLSDIVDFAAHPARGWKYTAVVHSDPADSNACAVCHDPHVVQQDLAMTGGAITEINSSPVKLWGVDVTEKMNSNYTINYQAPNCVTAGNEPECDGTADGTNLPDYVTFCTKCHDAGTTLFGTKTLKVINWVNEKHGQFNADINIAMNNPYVLAAGSYVLSCLDCHEPHGSGNQSLIRWDVNGGSWWPATVAGGLFDQLCRQCHLTATLWRDEHHSDPNPDALPVGVGFVDQPYDLTGSPACNAPAVGCHSEPAAPVSRIKCDICHFHGAVTGGLSSDGINPIPAPNIGVAPRELF